MPAIWSCVVWMTLCSPTIAGGGWVERHPPYGAAPLVLESVYAESGAAR